MLINLINSVLEILNKAHSPLCAHGNRVVGTKHETSLENKGKESSIPDAPVKPWPIIHCLSLVDAAPVVHWDVHDSNQEDPFAVFLQETHLGNAQLDDAGKDWCRVHKCQLEKIQFFRMRLHAPIGKTFHEVRISGDPKTGHNADVEAHGQFRGEDGH